MKKQIAMAGVAFMLSAATAMTSFAGWSKLGVNWSYTNEEGNKIVNDWMELDGVWYHFNARGDMNTGWFQDTDGKWYYFDKASGGMLANTETPDGYTVGPDGVYLPDKARTVKEMGPAGKLDYSSEGKLKVKDAEVDIIDKFATDNLATEAWGSEQTLEDLKLVNDWLRNNLETKGFNTEGVNPITITTEAVTYQIGNNAPELKLVKAGDHYELTDYQRIDDENIETALLAMSTLVSSTPQELYNQMYRALEINQRYIRDYEYTSYGDFQIMYRMDEGKPVFLIKAK